ncbi:hypothetical protein C8F04DRAFT_1387585 [Mycena alexandri]|uniref:Uncharacterized protein n=1 Tax=Mycena alexandri TaxID=1745969 RepID=A0AAD6TKP2_9AGAR|nr:hypothetical protein C8F04DRAFT_1387585 [Mycena alexandri]
MFEDDRCLSCGKVLTDGRAYCNDQCQNGDLTSPSLSSASSAFSSPHLAYTHGQDVPALVPSALGRALRAYTQDRYSASSSSASSTVWSLTDDDDDDNDFDDPRDHEPLYPAHALSYARRPSGTNTRSTVPRLHSRTASFEAPSSSSLAVCSLPQSAPGDVPLRFLDDDYADLDDFASEVASEFASEDPSGARPHTNTITAKAPGVGLAVKRKRTNRASLPAYFSMLQIDSSSAAATSSSSPHARVSPVSASSVHTVLAAAHPVLVAPARPSPPTPKLSLMAGLASAVGSTHAHHHHTPRGRRAASSRQPSSHSRSPSPARRRDSDEKVADWSSALARERGRAVRRNSSPSPPRPEQALRASSPSGSGSRARTRGRARMEELEGPRSPTHPGFGFGRSGLVGRARRGVGDEWVGVGR